jgi:glucose/arabinose dehydrogenase
MFTITCPLRTPRALFLLLLIACPGFAHAAAPTIVKQGNPDFIVEQLFSGLGVPWGMALVADQRLLVTERSGQARLLDLKSGKQTTVQGLPEILAAGQGGLLDVATGPDFARDGWIYFTYCKAVGDDPATTLARARFDGARLIDWQDLLVTDSATSSGQHFGSRIAFDLQGHVYFGVGDRGERHAAQDLRNHQGTIMRLELDGSVPPDNPFSGDSSARAEAWSYGHRNPQGMAYDAQTRRLWSIEHGPRGGDEINLVLPGRNYGWPVVSHGKEYWAPLSIGEGTSKPGMQDPHKVYIPSIAPGSLMFYHGDAFPAWRGNLFAGALKLRHLNRVSLAPNGEVVGEERLLEDLGERIRALLQGPQGWIYLSTDSGRILRLRPAPG